MTNGTSYAIAVLIGEQCHKEIRPFFNVQVNLSVYHLF